MAEKHEHSGSINDSTQQPPREGTDYGTVGWRGISVVLATCWIYFGLILVVVGSGFWRGTAAIELGGSAVSLWSSQSLNVVNAVLGPPISKVSDQIGRKWIILGCSVFGIMGSIVMATAKSMNILILGSVFVGVYWATIGSLSCIISEVVPRRWRGAVQVFLQIIGTLAVPVGTIAGAKLVVDNTNGYAGWRIVYWMATAFMTTGSAALFVLYNPSPVPNTHNATLTSRAFDFDKLGTVLFGAALTPLLMGLIWGGGGAYSWSAAPVIATLVVGCAFLAVFAAHQLWYKRDGLFNHELFRNRNYAICLFGLFVEGIVYYVFNNYFPTQVAVLYDARPIQFGLRYNVFVLGQLMGDAVYAFISYKYRSVIPSMTSGYILFLGSEIGLAVVGTDGSNASIGCTLIAGIGFAAPLALIQAVVQLSVPVEYIGVATSMALTFRSLGGAFGTAITGAVFNAKLTKWLPEYIASAALANGLSASSLSTFVAALASGNATLAATVPGATAQIVQAGGAAALEAYAKSFHYIWYVCIPFVVLAIISVLCMRSVKREMNDVIDRPLETVYVGPDTAAAVTGKDLEDEHIEKAV